MLGTGAGLGEWPLVGRKQELEYLLELLNAGSGVLIAGGAGVGKSRLAAEVVAVVGGDPAWVRATRSASAIPLGAVAHYLSAINAAATNPAEPDDVDAPRWLAQLAEAFAGPVGSDPRVLVVDDAQWLDDTTATLLHQLCAHGSIRLLATIRTGEPAPDAIVSLWKDHLVQRIELQPLSFGETLALLESALGPLDPTTAQRLWSATRGNVLYLREFVADASASGSLRDVDGRWRWTNPSSPVAGRLADLVAHRLQGLGDDERTALAMVALGEPVPAHGLSRLIPSADLRSMEQRGLLRSDVSHEIVELSLGHPIYGEVARSGLGELEKRRLWQDLAGIFGDHCPPREQARVTYWQLQSGTAPDATALERAAAHASAIADGRRAERLARAALRQRPSIATELALAEGLVLQGRSAEAEAVLARLARECRDDATQYRIAMARARALGGSAGLDSVVAAIDESRVRTSTERGRQALETVRVGALAAAGRTADAIVTGLALVDAALDAEILILAVGAVVPALTVSGRTTTSLALVQRAEAEIMERPGAFPGIATAAILSAHVFALLSNGSLDECDALIELVSALPSAASGVVFRTGYLDLAQGRIALARGRPSAAIAFLTTAAAGLSGADHLGGHAWALALLGEAYALLGRRADAQRVGAESQSAAQQHLQRYESDRQRALSWIDACAGRLSAAEQRLRAAATTCAAREEFGLEAHLHSDLMRLGDRRLAPQRLVELADVVDGPLAAGAHRSRARRRLRRPERLRGCRSRALRARNVARSR